VQAAVQLRSRPEEGAGFEFHGNSRQVWGVQVKMGEKKAAAIGEHYAEIK